VVMAMRMDVGYEYIHEANERGARRPPKSHPMTNKERGFVEMDIYHVAGYEQICTVIDSPLDVGMANRKSLNIRTYRTVSTYHKKEQPSLMMYTTVYGN
jgi:hypothetical protein